MAEQSQGQQPGGLGALPQSIPLTYHRDTKRLYTAGIDLNDPVDSIKEGHHPILENLRAYTNGIIQPRQGFTKVSNTVVVGQTPLHSIRRLNNPLKSTYTRILGVGTSIAYGQTNFLKAQYPPVIQSGSGLDI